MPGNKTKPTKASVTAYLAKRGSAEQQADARKVMAILKRVTGKTPHMWGPSIIGYGSYSYTYDSGNSGEAPVTGLAIRGREFVVYLCMDTPAQKALLAKVGKYKMGKSCFYFRTLADLDQKVFKRLVAGSIKEIRRRYP
jgi:hypothetical protein